MSTEYVTETLSANLSDRLAECRAEVAKLRERLRLTAQILAEEIGASGPANADDLARIAAVEVARLREVSNEYIRANAIIRAENSKYRRALIAITERGIMPEGDACERHAYWRNAMCRAEQIAINGLARHRTETGPLSDDSGPIAEDGK